MISALADRSEDVQAQDPINHFVGRQALGRDPVLGQLIERQALLELATAADRLVEETRILRRETDLLQDLLVRLRARGERSDLN